jgi:hypothetical protein
MDKASESKKPTKLPDPADSYERARPENTSPQGTLDGPNPPTHQAPDKNTPEGTTGRHQNRPNSDSMENSTRVEASEAVGKVDHSMHDEEPTGWDQAPQSISDPQQKRHSRTEGKGGVP